MSSASRQNTVWFEALNVMSIVNVISCMVLVVNRECEQFLNWYVLRFFRCLLFKLD